MNTLDEFLIQHLGVNFTGWTEEMKIHTLVNRWISMEEKVDTYHKNWESLRSLASIFKDISKDQCEIRDKRILELEARLKEYEKEKE